MNNIVFFIIIGCIIVVCIILLLLNNGIKHKNDQNKSQASKKDFEWYNVSKSYEYNEDGLPIDKKEPVSYTNTAYRFANTSTIYQIARVQPNEDWEYAYVGICKVNGKFYLVNERQKSYGVFLGGEEDVKEISFSEFKKKAKKLAKGITEDNALSFIPDDFCKIDMPTSVSCKIEQGQFSPNKDQIKVLFIMEELRFGTRHYELRKFDTGYRVEYYIRADNTSGSETYSRLISDSEFNIICTHISDDFYENQGELNSSKHNVSIYHGNYRAQGELLDGTQFRFADADYLPNLIKILRSASQGPIDVEGTIK